MTDDNKNMTVKEFVSSPWIRVIAVLLSVFFTAAGFVAVRAETDIRERIKTNSENIGVIEEDIDLMQDEINDIERNQTEIATTLRFIRQATEEIKSDVKELKKR